ncbi:MAG: hypothetical protein M3481_02535 [Actinomycetota bacterium]|nr:hypothetical protein [Actinomycetota bacterium]
MPAKGFFSRRSALTLVVAVVLAALLLPAGASAQGPGATFKCRSSVARVDTPLLSTPLEPLTANANENPCADDSAGVNNLEVPPGSPLVTTTTASARTDVLCRGDDPDPDVTPENNDDCDPGFRSFEQQVVARADVEDLTVNIPGLAITAEAANTRVRASCSDAGVATLESSSNLVTLTVNGAPVQIPEGGEPTTVELGLITIFINERIGTEGPLANGATTGELTRRALRIAAPGIADIVVAESRAGISGDVCPEGRIVIKKQTVPDEQPNATQFNFMAFGGLTPGAFPLTDDGTQVFENVPAGIYAIIEDPPPSPFRVGAIECFDPSDDTTADPSDDTTVSVEQRAVRVNLATAETVTCAFVNINGAGEIVCPPGTLPFQDTGKCVITDVKCPPNAVPSPETGKCVFNDVRCPDGTQFDPRTLACEPATGGRLVPKDEVPGIKKSPCKASRFGQGFAIIGTNGPDKITGSNIGDAIFAFGGNDFVSGGRGNDCVEGGNARDVLDGSNGNDLLLGGNGRDVLSGAVGNDTLRGGTGSDALSGARGRDRLFGGPGSDKLQGGFGSDLMVGGPGVDRISTGQGRDRVLGGPGNDIINATIVGPANRVDCGPGRRDRVRVNRNELKRIKNCEFVYLLDRRTPPLR